MKKHIIAAAAMLMTAAFSASAYDYSLQVNLNDGKHVEFEFASTPVATFADGEMTVTTHGQEKYTYIIANVQDMKILRSGSGISGVAVDVTKPSFRIEGGILSGAGVAPGSQVTVFNTSGMTVAGAKADEAGAFSMALDPLPKGVYVVSAAGVQFKFIK